VLRRPAARVAANADAILFDDVTNTITLFAVQTFQASGFCTTVLAD